MKQKIKNELLTSTVTEIIKKLIFGVVLTAAIAAALIIYYL